MKKLLFTLALIFTLLVSCEKEEIKSKPELPYYIGEWIIFNKSFGDNNGPFGDNRININIINIFDVELISSTYSLYYNRDFIENFKIDFRNSSISFEYIIEEDNIIWYFKHRGRYNKDKDNFFGFYLISILNKPHEIISYTKRYNFIMERKLTN